VGAARSLLLMGYHARRHDYYTGRISIAWVASDDRVFALRHRLQPSFIFAKYASATPAVANHWAFVSLRGLHSSHYGAARSAERVTDAFSSVRVMRGL